MLGLVSVLLAQFVLGPERSVAPVRPGISSPSQHILGIASDGTNQLVVWRDERSVIPAHSWGWGVITAARIDPQGRVLDIPNLVLPMIDIGPVVPFWNGHEYVIVSGGSYARISAAGEVLDPQPRTFPFPSSYASSLAIGGDRVLFAAGQRALLYDTSFNLLRDDVVLFETEGLQPIVASNGDGFLAVRKVYGDELQIRALDRNGNAIRSDTIWRMKRIDGINVASDGRGYLVTARTAPYLPPFGYFDASFSAFAISSEGIVTGAGGPFGLPLDVTSPADLKWQGDKYALVFEGSREDLLERHMNAAGFDLVTIDRNGGADVQPARFMEMTASAQSLVVSGLGPHMLFWSSDTPRSDTHFEWTVMTGQPYGDPAAFDAWKPQRFSLGQGSLSQETPAVATAGDVTLIAWRERDTARDPLALYATRIDRSGNPIDSQPLRIANLTCDATSPVVASNGTDFLVTWQEATSMRAMRIGHDGYPLDATPIVLSEMAKECGGLVPSIATNGSKYLILWRDDVALRAKLMSSDGTLHDVGPGLAGPKTTLFHAASDGHEFFITFTENFLTSATRVSDDGLARDLGAIFPSIHDVTLFWSGKNYVIGYGDLYERISPQGQRIDGAAKKLGRGFNPRIDCSADGCFAYELTANATITATRFDDTPGGITFETKTLAGIGADPHWSYSIFVFGTGALKNVAYLRMAPEAPYAGSWHVFVRPLLAPRARAIR